MDTSSKRKNAKNKSENTKSLQEIKKINEAKAEDSKQTNTNEENNEDYISKCIEEAIKEKETRTKLYIVYDEDLNKWKAIKEKGKRAIKMANTRTGLLNDLKSSINKDEFEIIVLKKRDIRKKYQAEKK